MCWLFNAIFRWPNRVFINEMKKYEDTMMTFNKNVKLKASLHGRKGIDEINRSGNKTKQKISSYIDIYPFKGESINVRES